MLKKIINKWEIYPTADKIATVNILITIIFSIAAVCIGWQQINLAERQSNSETKIAKFDALLNSVNNLVLKNSELISNTQALIDTQKTTNLRLEQAIDILISQHNISASEANFNTQQKLLIESNEYNEIASAMNELEPIINPFRIGRNNHIYLSVREINARLSFLDVLTKNIQILNKAASIMPFDGLPQLLDSCNNEIGEYKYMCLYNLSHGASNIDSSSDGMNLFCHLIYNYLNLEDSIGAHLYESRDRTVRNLRSIEKVIDSNNKIRNKIGEKRN
jgi:hypothetical protein